MRTYKAIITPTIRGGNIEVKISANSVYQAQEIIKTFPYFKKFVINPAITNETTTNLKKLIEQANKK